MSIKADLKALGSKDKRKVYMRFFKTGKGEYGEGDVFWGVTVPDVKSVAKSYYKDISLDECESLLHDPVHEVRLCALHILVFKYGKGDGVLKRGVYDLYVRNFEFVNNWDLVDCSAHKIVGDFVLNNPNERSVLYDLAKSGHLWSERVSVISCFTLIRANEFEDILKLSEMFLDHEHDLMHKAVGWMLREVGKRDMDLLRGFLNKHIKDMPRTMLRYSIERMEEKERKGYLSM